MNFSIFQTSMSALEVITHVIQMQHVQTPKVLINVNATLDMQEMDTIAQVYLRGFGMESSKPEVTSLKLIQSVIST